MNKLLFTILFAIISTVTLAQVNQQRPSLQKSIPADSLSYLNPRDYIIGGISVSGTKYLDKDVLVQISKLSKGYRINLPGEQNAAVFTRMSDEKSLERVEL